MLQSSLIPLARATGFGPLPRLLESLGGERALLRTFAAAGLPVSIRNEPLRPIPHISMIELFARSGYELGARTFGLEVGLQMTYRSYGRWADYCAGAPTLGEALVRGLATSWMHATGYYPEVVRDERWVVWRFPYPPMAGDVRLHADHLFGPMLDFARLYLGPDWHPDWAQTHYARDGGTAQLEAAIGAPIRFGRDGGVGIALRREDLARPRRVDLPLPPGRFVPRSVTADVVLSEAPEPARSLSAVVALRLLDGRSDIDGAARLAGISVRSLQRRLRQEDYTYRDVLDAARQARAITLLTETDLPLVEIALSLGYEDHANFTRAFRRWMGCAPSEYRRAWRAGRPITPA